MDCFQGWKKIYLFYGSIFFLLGWVGGCLRAPDGLTGLSAGLQKFTTDLRLLAAVAPDDLTPAVAVLAPASTAAVTFFYPESIAEHSVTLTSQLQKALTRHFARVEMKAVNRNVDFFKWFAGMAGKYPGQVVAGLEIVNWQPQRNEVHLWLWTVTTPPLPQLVKKLNFLPDAAQISVKIQRNSGFFWEVSWVETAPTGSTIPMVVAAWAETMSSQAGAFPEQRPVLQ
jgi:hypothetical protein